MKNIILGGGCFWCVEAAFENCEGIVHTEVGYTGGKDNPSYESVCNGDGNIEVVKIIYNEAKISLEQILSLFFKIHDPTSFDKQGADIGIQYRSAIFYENQNDKNAIEDFIKKRTSQFPTSYCHTNLQTSKILQSRRLSSALFYTQSQSKLLSFCYST